MGKGLYAATQNPAHLALGNWYRIGGRLGLIAHEAK